MLSYYDSQGSGADSIIHPVRYLFSHCKKPSTVEIHLIPNEATSDSRHVSTSTSRDCSDFESFPRCRLVKELFPGETTHCWAQLHEWEHVFRFLSLYPAKQLANLCQSRFLYISWITSVKNGRPFHGVKTLSLAPSARMQYLRRLAIQLCYHLNHT